MLEATKPKNIEKFIVYQEKYNPFRDVVGFVVRALRRNEKSIVSFESRTIDYRYKLDNLPDKPTLKKIIYDNDPNDFKLIFRSSDKTDYMLKNGESLSD